jgi:hypothetical protein
MLPPAAATISTASALNSGVNFRRSLVLTTDSSSRALKAQSSGVRQSGATPVAMCAQLESRVVSALIEFHIASRVENRPRAQCAGHLGMSPTQQGTPRSPTRRHSSAGPIGTLPHLRTVEVRRYRPPRPASCVSPGHEAVVQCAFWRGRECVVSTRHRRSGALFAPEIGSPGSRGPVHTELGRRLCGDRLQRADRRFDVVDVELAKQLSRGSADVLAKVLILRLTGGSQI